MVDEATLTVKIDVKKGYSQILRIRQGNFTLDGKPADGPVLLELNIQDIQGTYETAIPLKGINQNTRLSVEFIGASMFLVV